MTFVDRLLDNHAILCERPKPCYRKTSAQSDQSPAQLFCSTHVAKVANRKMSLRSLVRKHALELSYNAFVVVVVLLFYVHDKHLRSCGDGLLT